MVDVGQLECPGVMFSQKVSGITVVIGRAIRTKQLGNSSFALSKRSCITEQAFRIGDESIDKLGLELKPVFSYCLCACVPYMFVLPVRAVLISSFVFSTTVPFVA